jgi:hypothetical protein
MDPSLSTAQIRIWDITSLIPVHYLKDFTILVYSEVFSMEQ